MKTIHCQSLQQLDVVAQEIISFCGEEKIWVFKGQMGAGKTTLIKAIARNFGIVESVSSPTFSIVNEYRNDQGKIFYHFDFYRIEEAEEVLEIGIDEYFYSGHNCWLEWAERIPEYVPENFILISIKAEEDESRTIILERVINGEKYG